MISNIHRFHGHSSLSYVYKHGHVVRGPIISTKCVANNRREHYRLAVVVSKKVCKAAVDRNRIRRRVFEAVRLLEPKIQQPYDMVITVFNNALLTLPSPELQLMVHQQLKQAGVFGGQPNTGGRGPAATGHTQNNQP